MEEDLARNFVPEVVVLTAAGGHRGHEEVRQLAELLRRELPEASFTDTAGVVAGDVALLEWTARPRLRGAGAGRSRLHRAATTRPTRRRRRHRILTTT